MKTAVGSESGVCGRWDGFHGMAKGLAVLFSLCWGMCGGHAFPRIVINELHYEPEDITVPEEFVELFNAGDTEADLSGWSFSDGISYTFPAGVVVQPGGYLVVAESPELLWSLYDVTALGPFTGKLSNQEDRIELRDADGDPEDVVEYEVAFPWPLASAGDGRSMELIHPSLDNNLGGSWRASTIPPPPASFPIVSAQDAAWHYRKGTTNPTKPTTAWTLPDYVEDETWETGQTPIGYGAGTAYVTNTQLDDMRSNYSSFYLRRTLDLDNPNGIQALRVRVRVNDGCIVWINGIEAARLHVGEGEIPFNGTASETHDAAEWEEVNLTDPSLFNLTEEGNVLAVHVLNVSKSSINALIDLEFSSLVGTVWNGLYPSPGRQNSVYAENAPPQIREVAHSPQQPKSDEKTVVTAKATDPDGVDGVFLSYQIVQPGNYIPAYLPLPHDTLLSDPTRARDANPGFENPGNWHTVEMKDDGVGDDLAADDRVYTATLSSRPNRTLVRYRIVATDERDPPASVQVPYSDDPSLNFAYYVYDGVPSYEVLHTVQPGVKSWIYSSEIMNSLPVYALLTRGADVADCMAYDGALQIPRSNVLARKRFNWEGAFVCDGVVYDHMHYRVRGYNQRYQLQMKRNMRFRFNRGHWLQARNQKGEPYPTRWRSLNLSKMYGPRNVGNFGVTETLNNFLYDLVGVPAPFVHTIHFRVVDGIEEAPGGPNGQYEGDFWGMFLTMEDFDSGFLDAHSLPKGNLYKLKDGIDFDTPGFTGPGEAGKEQQRYQAADAVSNAQDYDLIRFSLHHDKTENWLRTYVDYDEWIRYQAVTQAIRHYDTGVYPGPDEDRTSRNQPVEDRVAPADTPALKNVTWYFHPEPGNFYGKLWYLPWDTEQSWGENGSHQGWDLPLFAMIDPQIQNGREKIDYTGGPNAKPGLYVEYRNFLREFRDLIWNEEVLAPLIDRVAAVVKDFANADRDRWKNHPLTGDAQSDFGSLEDRVEDLKTFAFVGGDHWPVLDRPETSKVEAGGRAVELDERSNYGGDLTSIPQTSTVTAKGPGSSPVESLWFETTPFEDPQGTQTFGSMKWRVAEVSDPSAPAYDPNADPLYEWNAVWNSGEIGAFQSSVRVPPNAVKVGHAYRIRVRMKDNTGRWGHWSAPVQFVPTKATTHSPGEVLITEFFADAVGSDEGKEWIEVFNTTDANIDLAGWTLADNGDESVTIGSLRPVVVPTKGYFVLGQSVNPNANGRAPVQYAYGNTFTMGNNADEIVLLEGNTVIHSVAYGDYSATPYGIASNARTGPEPGVALGMATDYCDRPATVWRTQTTQYNAQHDRATPGTDNDGVAVCVPDDAPPQLLEAHFARRNVVFLRFDEPLDEASARTCAHYTVTGGKENRPFLVCLEGLDAVLLTFAAPFDPDVSYTVAVREVADVHSNPIVEPQSLTDRYSIPRVSITELMYNNRGNDLEWIELLNTTVSPIDMSGWYLTDDNEYPAQGEGNAVLPPGTVIQPGEHLVVNLWNDPGFGLWQMGPGIRVVGAVVADSGRLGNGGDNIALFDSPSGGTLVDGSLAADFPDLSSDGRSLEKIDEFFPWGHPSAAAYNFAASPDPIGFKTGLNESGEYLSDFASPGRPNGSDFLSIPLDLEPPIPDGIVDARDLVRLIQAMQASGRVHSLCFGVARCWHGRNK